MLHILAIQNSTSGENLTCIWLRSTLKNATYRAPKNRGPTAALIMRILQEVGDFQKRFTRALVFQNSFFLCYVAVWPVIFMEHCTYSLTELMDIQITTTHV
jgi:hypothetical protein